MVKNTPAMQETMVQFLGRESWRRGRLPTSVFLGFPFGSALKESTCNAGDLGSIPDLGSYPGEGNGYPLQYSGLENSMDCIEKETVTTTSFYIATNKKMNVSKTRTPNKKIKQVRCSRWRLKN